MKNNKDLVLLGSQTAKNGFKNEADIAAKFNNWQTDPDVAEWLAIMGYKISDIAKITANTLPNKYKSDIQVKITIKSKNTTDNQGISIKLVSNPHGFNQIDKRWVDAYIPMWDIPKSIARSLKMFTGEILPIIPTKDSRRMFLNELDQNYQKEIVNFFDQNKTLIMDDIIKGRGELAADWMMIAFNYNGVTKWILKDIDYTLSVFSNGNTTITNQGSLKIGKVTMQRKGGDNGRKTAQMLQFKINPMELFN